MGVFRRRRLHRRNPGEMIEITAEDACHITEVFWLIKLNIINVEIKCFAFSYRFRV